ncbi:DoxX [Roseivivax jejudonensis]|uniref:DoxX n=1 Tax=Roseivivax jejudonensis TaxID=1529041 RepID=A0A1X6ZH36_9RHOB|nr:DoxX family protein [Roseivivax jejudonensis]SLN51054.1 DoxX [Roseivivax jejudonensis]
MLHRLLFQPADRHDALLPLLARLVFAATLLSYFWAAGLTKLGDGALGLFSPSTGAYAQIFPRQFEAVGYDASQFGLWHWAVTVAGTWAEFLLPLAIVIGLLTRLAALGMIGFIVVQSLTDLYGHGGIEHAETLGAWFDRIPDAAILDQRALWVFLLLVLVVKGGGLLSADALIARGRPGATAPRPA